MLTVKEKNMSIYQILEAYSSKTRYFKIMSILNRYPRYPSNPAYFRKRILASQPQLRTGSSKNSGTVMVEQWNNNGGTVGWNNEPVMVEQ